MNEKIITITMLAVNDVLGFLKKLKMQKLNAIQNPTETK